MTWFLHTSPPPHGATVVHESPRTSSPVVLPARAREPVRARPRPGSPRRLLIPALGVRAPVVPVDAVAGTLVPPSDPTVLGWWAQGALPGAAQGSAVITGHTVHEGGGTLDHLADVRRGDRLVVRTDHQRLRYVARRVAVYRKGVLARRAPRLFSRHAPGRLVVVTCGDWNGIRYLSNVVVVATPVVRPAAASAG